MKIRPTIALVLASLVALMVLTSCWRPATPATKITMARSGIQMFRVGLDLYRLNCGVYPTNAQGLNALIVNPGTPGWHGPYIVNVAGRGVPLDPWGTPYRYRTTGTNIVVNSAGPDRTFGTADDI